MAVLEIHVKLSWGTSSWELKALRGVDRNLGPRLSVAQNHLPCWPRMRVQTRTLVMKQSGGAQDNIDDFVKRMEQTWMITKQPRPVQCNTCNAAGKVECPWCKGTGFFVLGDNLLCEVPSRNTSCHICLGKGTISCDDCKGTGYRAKWLGDPNKPNQKDGKD